MRFISLGASLLFVVALVFGGGARHGLFSDFFPQFLSLALLVSILLHWHDKATEFGWPFYLLIAILILPFLQLIPLPKFMASWLPGRAELNTSLTSLGLNSEVTSLSLRPSETLRSAYSLFPAAALFLVAPFLSLHRRVKLVLILAVFVFVSILIGFLQIMGGAGSGLYFYDVTNIGRAVGFFANANHFTALLYASLPFVLAIFAERSEHIFSRSFVMLGVVTFIWLVGLSISGSRSALILGGLSLGLSFFLFVRHAMPVSLSTRSDLLSAVLLGLVIIPVLMGVGLTTILNRFEAQDMIEDARAKILPIGLSLVWLYLPFGSGFGTFRSVYAQHEPVDAVMPTFVNHAHNDVLELAIEGGVLALALVIIWALYISREAIKQFARHNDLEGRLAKAGLISIALLALHSFWDYPLRTIALMLVFALAHGFLWPARHHHSHEPHLLEDMGARLTVWDVMPVRSKRKRRFSNSANQ